MAVYIITDQPAVRVPIETMATRPRFVRRRVTPETGRALEILGHAIEYLTDEYVHHRGTFLANDPEVQAIQLLMKLNRQIYFNCLPLPSLADRCRTWLRTAASH